jgi:hypothetical protein
MPGPPRCHSCGHPWTLHGSGKTRCKATGCSCPEWSGPTLMAVKTVSVADAAEHTGKTELFLRRHAKALGGLKVSRKDLGLGGGSSMLRFEISKLDDKLPRLERKLANAKDH